VVGKKGLKLISTDVIESSRKCDSVHIVKTYLSTLSKIKVLHAPVTVGTRKKTRKVDL
jgi:hypothetical protein